ELTALLLNNPKTLTWALISLCTLCGLALCLALMNTIKNTSKLILSAFIITATLMFFMQSKQNTLPATDAATKAHPNIIVVVVDSFRPDYLLFFGGNKATPFMDSLLANAVVFSDAVTPIARTFPAWTSILTGKYPLESGARFDLAAVENLHLS